MSLWHVLLFNHDRFFKNKGSSQKRARTGGGVREAGLLVAAALGLDLTAAPD